MMPKDSRLCNAFIKVKWHCFVNGLLTMLYQFYSVNLRRVARNSAWGREIR